ncbi:hypothetical protein LguiB_022485 [Lonicera macranthoides]
MMIITIFVGFFFGALTIIAIEAVGVLYLVRRFNRKIEQQKTKAAEAEAEAASKSPREVCYDYPDLSHPNKQGIVWVLEAEKVPKILVTDKRPKDKKRKKEIVEVTPVRKFAKIKDQSLILRESDGSHIGIWLKGCMIVAVSATRLSSRKWAKRYPIKVENKASVIYHGSNTLYIYLETSEEKESWCKALRLASCEDKEKLKLFSKLRLEFHSYLTSLHVGYTSFMKPSMGFNAEVIDKTMKLDGSSKVRRFFKKLSRKSSSKSCAENKMSWAPPTSGHEERRFMEKSRSFHDPASASGLLKPIPRAKTRTYSADENMLPPLLANFTRSEGSDVDPYDKVFSDEGTLCVNLLISRLFFDAKSNAEIKSIMQARIQRSLSNLRSPSYIGEITCTGINPGNLPPYIHGMRVLPSDMNEVVALEIDVDYSGGAMLDIETRLEVREEDFQDVINTNLESSSAEGVTPHIIEGIEYLGQQLKLPEGTGDEIEQKDGDPKLDEMKRSKSNIRQSSSISRWRSFRNSIAKQVSQVPIALGIRVASLRGTLRVHIKPPPSDQIWFGFTTMPDVDFNLESSVGERKINSGQVTLFLSNRFKAAIRETMVLPNSESIAIPWMLAEKDDWVPREVAPFIWVSDQSATREVPTPQHSEPTHMPEPSRVPETNNPEEKDNSKRTKPKSVHQLTIESSDACAPSSAPMNNTTPNESPLQELRTPLLACDEPEESCQPRKEEGPMYKSPSLPLITTESQNQTVVEGDDKVPKKMGAKARMLSLRKRVGDKLEEKRRHLEVRSKSMVERMRGGSKTDISGIGE